MSKRIEFSVSDDVFDKIEQLRGDVPRARWVMRAVLKQMASQPVGWVPNENATMKAPPKVAAKARVIEESVVQPAAALSAKLFHCRQPSCGFSAPSSKAKCRDHGGALVER